MHDTITIGGEMMIKIYIVGPLFSQDQVRQRKYEGETLRNYLLENNIENEVFNPIDMTFDDDSCAADIHAADYERLSDSDVIFIDLSQEDSGSCVALGITLEKYKNGKDIKFYPVISDIRLSRNGKSGLESSCGYNSMVVGAFTANNIKIYDCFENAFKAFKQDLVISDIHQK